MTQHHHHRIDYIEISSTDIDASRRFYEKAFGWVFTEYGPGYLGIQDGEGGEQGGLTQTESVPTGGPLVVLYSQDLEASLAAVREAGGEVHQEIFSFPGGRRFQFKDPAGNELAVWSDQGA